MPIIFAQAIMMLPIIIAGYSNSGSGFVVAFSNMYGFWYNLVIAILIIVFTYFYTAITINPIQMAEDMKKNGGFIPGIKPGRKTVEFLDTIMSRITFTRINLPGNSCDLTFYCSTGRSYIPICTVLWRYFTADSGRSSSGYTAAD